MGVGTVIIRRRIGILAADLATPIDLPPSLHSDGGFKVHTQNPTAIPSNLRKEDGHGSALGNRSWGNVTIVRADGTVLKGRQAEAESHPVALSTEDKTALDLVATRLQSIYNSLQGQREVATSVWTDNSGAYYVRRDLIDESSGTPVITVTFTDGAGAPATPGAGLRPVGGSDRELSQVIYVATAAGAGYSVGDILGRIAILDVAQSPPSASALWLNLTTGALIATPAAGSYEDAGELVGIKGADGSAAASDANPLPVRDTPFKTSIESRLGLLGRKPSTGSAPVALSDEQEGILSALTKPGDTQNVRTVARSKVAGLSFVSTIASLGSHQTAWVDTSLFKYLDVDVELQDASAVSSYFEFTDAPNPNVTPPGANDVVRRVPPPGSTLAGKTLSGLATSILSFGVHARMTWCRITATDLTGGQTLKVVIYGLEVPAAAPQLPIAADLTTDYLLPAGQVIIKERDPSGHFQSTRFPGLAANQGMAGTLAAGATFTAPTRMSTAGFNGLVIALQSDANSAPDGVRVRIFTAQTGGLELVREFGASALSETYSAAPAVRFLKFPLYPGFYFQVELHAGAVSPMTNTFFQATLVQEVEDVSLPLDDNPDGATVADVVKSQLIGAKDNGGGYASMGFTGAKGNPKFAIDEHRAETPLKAMAGAGDVDYSVVDTGPAIELGFALLLNRKGIGIKAASGNTDRIWYGYSPSIAPGNKCWPLDPGDVKELDFDETIPIYLCSSANGQHYAFEQVSDPVP